MGLTPEGQSTRSSLRGKILAFVGGLVLVSLLGSTISLYRITQVNGLLDAINRVSAPLGRLLAQMQSDADVFRRELDRSLGNSHWQDPHWQPRPVPRWIEDVLESEVQRARDLVKADSDWATDDGRSRWRDWAAGISQGLTELQGQAAKLYNALAQKDEAAAAELYPKWNAAMEDWRRQLQWGSTEYERSLRQTFSLAESRVAELRTGLELVLGVVVLLSLLLLWLGERALRPLAELTRLARDITRRGLRKEDKALLPDIPVTRSDEVSQLAREFHHMATALLEREKTVETQKHRLQEQNRLLRDIGELNENILNSIESVLMVTDLEGNITQCNPVAARWLGAPADEIIGTRLLGWSKMQSWEAMGAAQWVDRIRKNPEAWKVEPAVIDGRVYGGQVMPLRQVGGLPHGAIFVFEDLTADLDLQERLRLAENLAAVGRLSAQVAHEVRNPLHSIGLEAEVAVEMAAQFGHLQLKQSLQSILGSVDRLDKITENYLRLSRLSAGEKREIDIGEILERVLATYTPVCESQRIRVDWHREAGVRLKIIGDGDLLEQILGNLLRNSLQALDGLEQAEKRIDWSMGAAESGRIWLKIEDNGPGISPEIRSRLFTPFVTTRANGTGLGLSFVKKVVEEHGGAIECASSPRQGACFTIVFPALQAAGLSGLPEIEVVHG